MKPVLTWQSHGRSPSGTRTAHFENFWAVGLNSHLAAWLTSFVICSLLPSLPSLPPARGTGSSRNEFHAMLPSPLDFHTRRMCSRCRATVSFVHCVKCPWSGQWGLGPAHSLLFKPCTLEEKCLILCTCASPTDVLWGCVHAQQGHVSRAHPRGL